MGERAGWTAVLPLRALPAAKSRLAADLPAEWPSGLHAVLVRAIRQDTLAAVAASAAVARVLVVVDGLDAAAVRPTYELLVQSTPGLNGAVGDGARAAAARWPDDGVVALVGDLPALTGSALDDVLARAARVPRGFVADATGSGTTLITAAPGVVLEPRFGIGSARRHSRVATALPADACVRQDVDTLSDLAAAAALGLGPASADAYGLLPGAGGRMTV